MLTVPELKALAVGMDLKLGSRNGSNRQAMLAWYSRTVLSPAPASTVSFSTRVLLLRNAANNCSGVVSASAHGCVPYRAPWDCGDQ